MFGVIEWYSLVFLVVLFLFDRNTKVLAAYGINKTDYETQKDDTASTNERYVSFVYC